MVKMANRNSIHERILTDVSDGPRWDRGNLRTLTGRSSVEQGDWTVIRNRLASWKRGLADAQATSSLANSEWDNSQIRAERYAAVASPRTSQ